MRCHFCSKPATVHLTDILNEQKREMHLCEACAREKDLIPTPQELNVPAILQLVLSQMASAAPRVPAEPVCPACGIPYAHFKAQGRLGCPHDYDIFRTLLEPLVERVQAGYTRHTGKVPGRHRRRMTRARLVELDAQLRTAVAAERFEEAARLRDAIRALGTDHEP